MSRREFPDWLEAFVNYVKSFSETPEKFLYWSAVSAIATAVERRIWIDQGRYVLYPNFFVVFVADPGRIQKTTTINAAKDLVKKLQGVNIAPKSCTWEGFVQLLTQLQKAENELESLDTPNTATAPVLVPAGELSTFLDPKDEGKVSALIDLWDCPDVFDRFTKMYQMETVEQPCINILSGTTPSWIRDNFTRWNKEGGLAARIIFLYEFKKRQLIAFPKRRKPPNATEIESKLIRDLEYMQQLRGEFVITEEAYDFGEKWYEAHNKAIEGYDEVTGLIDRKQTHILKLAMIIAVSRRESRSITLQDMRDATHAVDLIEGDFAKVFSVVDERFELRPITDIRKLLQKHGTLEWSRLVSLCSGKYLLFEVERAIAMLINTREVEKMQVGTRITYTYKGHDDTQD